MQATAKIWALVLVLAGCVIAGFGPYRYELYGTVPVLTRLDTWTGTVDVCIVEDRFSAANCTRWWKPSDKPSSAVFPGEPLE